MKFIVVIPARFKSSRLPGKPLIEIQGKSLLQRTYEQCLKAVSNDKIFVATDDIRIFNHCKDLSFNVLMTSDNCLTGTDRVAEVSQIIDVDHYINVQGDEPLMNPEDIIKIINTIKKYPKDVVNGFAPINNQKDYRSISIPKVVVRPDGRLLYMSRSPIPGNKDNIFNKAWRQVCVYGFPKFALEEFSQRNIKTTLENEEDIEIIRFLEMGFEVRMTPLSANSVAVDTPEDLKKVKAILEKSSYE